MYFFVFRCFRDVEVQDVRVSLVIGEVRAKCKQDNCSGTFVGCWAPKKLCHKKSCFACCAAFSAGGSVFFSRAEENYWRKNSSLVMPLTNSCFGRGYFVEQRVGAFFESLPLILITMRYGDGVASSFPPFSGPLL